MPKLQSLAALLAASVTLAVSAPAVAAPVTVNLRVEGSTQTLSEGPVTTDAKTLNKDATGSHPCDGTNAGMNSQPGPTMTGAMDDGITSVGLTWDGSWDNGFQDFFVNRIGPDANSSQSFWGYLLNWKFSDLGGCQQQVQQGDQVLFALAKFGEQYLQLTAPQRAATGEPVDVSVAQNDGQGNRTPAPGADVGGATTDVNGHATLSFTDAGDHVLKANRSDSIRSNAATVCIYAPGSGACGTDKPSTETPTEQPPSPPGAVKDTTPPVVHVTSPKGKTYASGPRELSGTIDERGGIAQVFLRLRMTSASRCRWFSGKRGVFTHRTVACSKARFFRIGSNARWSYLLPSRLGKGHYVLDVKVLDRAYNPGRTTVPFMVK